jgi:hypothetical protein
MTFRVHKLDVSCEVVIKLLYKIHNILAFQKIVIRVYTDLLCTTSDIYVASVYFISSNFFFYFSYIYYIRHEIIEEVLGRKAIKCKRIIRIILKMSEKTSQIIISTETILHLLAKLLLNLLKQSGY